MTLTSLFDGSGGFPLAASLCGIEPIQASEIEPYPIAVTRSRFPNMKHLGDVSKVNGAEIESTNIISFGSPCQDLSVAGQRRGMKHSEKGDEETTRSGMFMEAIRIIREMREATNGEYPTIALWENVPGAFSSNKGEDFRIVLEEFCKIKYPEATMPPPEGKWPYADIIVGDGFSIAYRVLDAQYWGVPQRRKRIYLVADFGSECAGEILFEPCSVQRDTPEGTAQRERTPERVEDRFGEPHKVSTGFAGYKSHTAALEFREERTPTLEATMPMNVLISFTATAPPKIDEKGEAFTLTSRDYKDPPCVVIPIHDKATRWAGKRGEKHDGAGNGLGVGRTGDPMYTLTGGDKHAVSYAMQGFGDYQESETASTLKSRDYKDATALIMDPIARRLTPLECNRLQGFPEHWGEIDNKEGFTEEGYNFWLDVRNTFEAINGKQIKDYTEKQMLKWYNKLHTDSAEYKMWGNGIALPNALYVMEGIARRLKGDKNGCKSHSRNL